MENQRKRSVIPTDFPFVENSVDDAIRCSYARSAKGGVTSVAFCSPGYRKNACSLVYSPYIIVCRKVFVWVMMILFKGVFQESEEHRS